MASQVVPAAVAATSTLVPRWPRERLMRGPRESGGWRSEAGEDRSFVRCSQRDLLVGAARALRAGVRELLPDSVETVAGPQRHGPPALLAEHPRGTVGLGAADPGVDVDGH